MVGSSCIRSKEENDVEAKVKLLALLEKSGAKLVRNTKHQIFKLPNGLSITLPRDADTSFRAWENVYHKVQRRLEGYITKKEILEKKRLAYKPEKERRQEFLAGLPEREDRPQTPISPSPKGKPLPRAFEYNPNTPDPPVRVSSGPGIAYVALSPAFHHNSGKVKMIQHPSSRSGECISLSKEVLTEANRILLMEGEVAKNKYLDCIRNGREYISREETVMPIEPVRVSGASSIQEVLDENKGHLARLGAQLEQIKLEMAKREKIVEALSAALQISAAPLADFRAAASSNGNGQHAEKSVNIRWKEVIKEIVATSPQPIKRKALMDEMHTTQPTASIGSVYQAISQAMKAGWLLEKGDEKGYFMHVVER
jgi:hypothetical protein